MISNIDKNVKASTEELSNALMRYSKNRLEYNQAKAIAKLAIENIKVTNIALSTKSLNWYAKELVDLIIFE